MDCFGLGGILVKEEDVQEVVSKHKDFCAAQGINYPLHSSRIRGGRGKFAWLKTPEKAGIFMPALEEFLLDLPVVGIACVVHRPGYVERYKASYAEQLWLMCKTAFTILVERSAKFADGESRALEIYHEEAGKKEDRDIINYIRELKTTGSPFSEDTSDGYAPLTATDYKRIILGEPHRRTKKMSMLQVADLLLYPMAKGGYDAAYRPYSKLREAGKLIDCHLTTAQIPQLGIKYSCFDG